MSNRGCWITSLKCAKHSDAMNVSLINYGLRVLELLKRGGKQRLNIGVFATQSVSSRKESKAMAAKMWAARARVDETLSQSDCGWNVTQFEERTQLEQIDEA
jgi:hypothetical protein